MSTQEHDDGSHLLPPADPLAEIERLRNELAAERDRHLRTLADFKNYRRRSESNGDRSAEEGRREIILPLLEIIDDMEKALQWASVAEQPIVKGVRIIHAKLLAMLESHGVVPFESAGSQFNHDRHQAVGVTENIDQEPGTVVDELRRGYLWKSELLRPAQVRVAE